MPMFANTTILHMGWIKLLSQGIAKKCADAALLMVQQFQHVNHCVKSQADLTCNPDSQDIQEFESPLNGTKCNCTRKRCIPGLRMF